MYGPAAAALAASSAAAFWASATVVRRRREGSASMSLQYLPHKPVSCKTEKYNFVSARENVFDLRSLSCLRLFEKKLKTKK